MKFYDLVLMTLFLDQQMQKGRFDGHEISKRLSSCREEPAVFRVETKVAKRNKGVLFVKRRA